jgi:ClpP class serine protease
MVSGLTGEPFPASITRFRSTQDILRAIELTDPSVPIDLIVHTPGGLVLAAEQIAGAFTGTTQRSR